MVVPEKHLLSFHRITGYFTKKRAGFSPALTPYSFKYKPHREDFQRLQKGCYKHLVAGRCFSTLYLL